MKIIWEEIFLLNSTITMHTRLFSFRIGLAVWKLLFRTLFLSFLTLSSCSCIFKYKKKSHKQLDLEEEKEFGEVSLISVRIPRVGVPPPCECVCSHIWARVLKCVAYACLGSPGLVALSLDLLYALPRVLISPCDLSSPWDGFKPLKHVALDSFWPLNVLMTPLLCALLHVGNFPTGYHFFTESWHFAGFPQFMGFILLAWGLHLLRLVLDF